MQHRLEQYLGTEIQNKVDLVIEVEKQIDCFVARSRDARFRDFDTFEFIRDADGIPRIKVDDDLVDVQSLPQERTESVKEMANWTEGFETGEDTPF